MCDVVQNLIEYVLVEPAYQQPFMVSKQELTPSVSVYIRTLRTPTWRLCECLSMIQARISPILAHSAVSPYRASTSNPYDLNDPRHSFKPVASAKGDDDGIEGFISGLGDTEEVL